MKSSPESDLSIHWRSGNPRRLTCGHRGTAAVEPTEFFDGLTRESIAKRLRSNVLELALRLQVPKQLVVRGQGVPDETRRLRHRLARVQVPRVRLRIGNIDRTMRKISL